MGRPYIKINLGLIMVKCNFVLYRYNISLVPTTFTSAFPKLGACVGAYNVYGTNTFSLYKNRITVTATILIMKPNLKKSPAKLTSY